MEKIDRTPVRRVVYSFVVADLFHYGHLQLLQTAKSLGDLHICGVLSDEAAETYRSRPVANFEERLAVISSIKCVDRLLPQTSKDPEANLRKIHSEFPEAELILVHGNDWQNIPGRDYVESIGGRVIQPAYYKRLADSVVKSRFSQDSHQFEDFTEHFHVKNIHYFTPREKRFAISTKGNTLQSLQPLLTKSRIEKTFIFRVGDWKNRSAEILSSLQQQFTGKIVVRSSAINEDSYHSSKAGYYESCLDVQVRQRSVIERAIRQVVASYSQKNEENDLHQILVQSQTEGVHISGVVFTRHNQTAAPYYVINYDDRTGRTDTVTAGKKSAALEISHLLATDRCPRFWRPLIAAVREIEEIIPGTPLDIEFAIDKHNRIVIFQVRPLVIQKNPQPQLINLKKILDRESRKLKKLTLPVRGERGQWNIFSDMAFWNPAEIVGRRPNPLSFSLYRNLITDRAWNQALLPLGYSRVPLSRLMVSFAGKPYIDVRKSFNTLLPASIQKSLREKLVHYFLDKLKASPELHDKVEFDILETCYVFGFDKRMRAFRKAGFSSGEISHFKEALVELTRHVVTNSHHLIKKDREIIKSMGEQRELLKRDLLNTSLPVRDRLELALQLLNEARNYGVIPFTRLARMAFISKALLRSLVSKGWIHSGDYDRFFDSLKTVAKQFGEDFKSYSEGRISHRAFLEKYGHLRPGTYDITSPRYDRNSELFKGDNRSQGAIVTSMENEHQFPPAVMVRIDRELRRCHLGFDSRQLLIFARKSLEGREAFKFEFTKNLSDALEHIALAGTTLGFSREELSYLNVGDLKQSMRMTTEDSIRQLWRARINMRRQQARLTESVSLPPIFLSAKDLFVINHIRSKPNFVTGKAVEGQVIELQAKGQTDWDDLSGKLALIENADPGYDWIFTKNIKGLITRYGGVASHMAIRCAEFGLPAAIGCGDLLYEEIKSSRRISLNCGEGRIVPLP